MNIKVVHGISTPASRHHTGAMYPLVGNIWSIHAEELCGMEGCGGRILKGKGEFDHFCDREVRRWKKVVFQLLRNQELGRQSV
jgi:hypothetical protein